MAKKKTRYPKRKGQIIRASIVAILILALAGAGAFAYVSAENKNKSYIMTILDKQVSTEEYKLYVQRQKQQFEYYLGGTDIWAGIDGVDYGEVAKEGALDSLVFSIIMKEQAQKLNITLTEEEQTEAKTLADEYKTSLETNKKTLPAITDERLVEIMGESTLSDKVYQDMIKEYVIDEADFKTVYKDYLANNKSEYLTVNANYVVTETKEEAEAAKAAIDSGTDIKDVVKEFSIKYVEGAEIVPVSISSSGLAAEAVSAAFTLKVDEVSEPVQTADGFVVIKVAEIVEPTYSELESTRHATYVQTKQDEIFQAKYEELKIQMPYTLNQKAYDSVKVIDL